jgi:hypothetical protein
MKFHVSFVAITLLLSSTSASPLPNIIPSESRSYSDVQAPTQPAISPSSGSSTVGKFAALGAAAVFLAGASIGISEWALNWYGRFTHDQNLRNQQNQTLQDERSRRQEQQARRERAMDLILDMAENYSEKVGSSPDFDGNFEPLKVPSSIVGAVENVFQETADIEGGGIGDETGPMDSLESLKDALKPILEFNRKET